MSQNEEHSLLAEIVLNTADRVRGTFKLEIDTLLPTVCISDTEKIHDDIFFQESEASDFLDLATDLYEKAKSVSLDDAQMCLAAPYAETIWN